VRRNSPIAAGLKQINRLARWLERRGLVDLAASVCGNRIT